MISVHASPHHIPQGGKEVMGRDRGHHHPNDDTALLPRQFGHLAPPDYPNASTDQISLTTGQEQARHDFRLRERSVFAHLRPPCVRRTHARIGSINASSLNSFTFYPSASPVDNSEKAVA